MALPSSPNQISMSQIAAEFGGSAPHSLSEYYSKGNAPSSGEIQMGADFHGTSNATTLNTTMNVGFQQHKVAVGNRGFMASSSRRHGVSMIQGVSNGAIGSLANATTSSGGVVEAAYLRTGQDANGNLDLNHYNFILEMTVASTAWTSITLIGNAGTTTLNRTSASTSDNQFFEWSAGGAILNSNDQGNNVTFRINA